MDVRPMDIYGKKAEACRKIREDKACIFSLTSKQNNLAVATDGSSVPGLGNVGPSAALPVAEEVSSVLGDLTGLNAVPICPDTQNTDYITDLLIKLSPSFGGIYLESISAPRCYDIEERLAKALDIPAFNGERWGKAAAALAFLLHKPELSGDGGAGCPIVVDGFGSLGTAVTKLLTAYGFGNITVCDGDLVLNPEMSGLNSIQREILLSVNNNACFENVAEAVRGARIFIETSLPGRLTEETVAIGLSGRLAEETVAIDLSGSGTGKDRRAFPGVSGAPDPDFQFLGFIISAGLMKGALFEGVSRITEKMLISAAGILASAPDDDLWSRDISISNVIGSGLIFDISRAVSENK